MRPWLWIVVVALLLASCRGASEGDTAAPAPVPSEQTVTKGPVTLVATLDRTSAEVGERLTLSLDVTAETGVDVQMPSVGDVIGSFEVREPRTPPDVPEEGRRRWRHQYGLETFESGDLEVPALAVAFTDARSGEVIEAELATDPIPVRVASLVDEAELTAAVDVKDAVPVPIERTAPWWILLLVLLLMLVSGWIAVLAVLARLLFGRRVAGVVIGPAAHVWALAALDSLEAEGLVEAGRVHEFYVGLTGVVREYIERRFAVHAPERTTEEFLREARRHPVLGGAQRDALGAFLRSADMVKFARYRPEPGEIGDALASARRFVHETAQRAGDEFGAAA